MHKELKIPVLRFPEFKGEWEPKKLREAFHLTSGQHLNPDGYSKTESNHFSIPYFTGPSDFTNNKEQLTKWTSPKSKKAIKGEMLITVKGSGVGSSMFLHLEVVAIGRQLMAIGSKSHSTTFLYQKLETFTKYFIALASGNMIPGLSRDDILHTKISFPSLPEQTRIASFFTGIDQKISQLQKKKDLLEQYKKGVMQKLFSQEIRFKDKDGNHFPKWEKKKLGKIAKKVNSGKTPLGGASVYSPEGVLFIRSQNVNNDRLELEHSTYIPHTINEQMKNSLVQPNDILLNITGASLGRSCVVPNEISIANVNQHVCIIRLDEANVPKFVQLVLSSTKGQNTLFSLQTGSGREGLNFQSIRSISLHLPSLPEQTRIADFLTTMDDKINQTDTQIRQTQEWKKGLLQKMFV